VVQAVHRSQHELRVPLRIDVVQRRPGGFAQILDIDRVVHHQDAFGEHRLAEPPDAVHHLARVPRIRFADGHDDQVVEHAFERQVNVHDLGKLLAHHRQQDPFDGLAHPAVLHGRPPDNGRVIDRLTLPGDALDVEHRIIVRQRVKAGVVAERALPSQLAGLHVALEHDLRCGRNFQVNRPAGDHLHGAAAQESGENHLVEILGQGQRGGEGDHRIGPDRHSHLQAATIAEARAVVVSAPLVDLPVHAGGRGVVKLHPVHAAVALAGDRIP